MSNEKSEEMLANVNLKIKKRGIAMGMAICTKNKLEVILITCLMATDSGLSNTYSRYHHMKFLVSHQNYFQKYSHVLYSLMKFMFSKWHSMLLPIYKFSAT